MKSKEDVVLIRMFQSKIKYDKTFFLDLWDRYDKPLRFIGQRLYSGKLCIGIHKPENEDFTELMEFFDGNGFYITYDDSRHDYYISEEIIWQ